MDLPSDADFDPDEIPSLTGSAVLYGRPAGTSWQLLSLE